MIIEILTLASTLGVLLTHGQEATIYTPQATIHVNKGAIVFVDALNPDTTIVYSLHEHTPHDVMVETANKRIYIAPARAAFITTSGQDDFEQLPGRRDFVQYFLPSRLGQGIWLTNFVLTTLIASEVEFGKLLNSEDPEDQKVVNDLLKTAVMLHHDAPKTLTPQQEGAIGKHCSL